MANRLSFVLALLNLALLVAGSPSDLDVRPDNIVVVRDTNAYCMIMPRDPHTDIGASEHPGGMQTFCSASAKTSSKQGEFPDSFWSKVSFRTGNGAGRYAQLTGCIRPDSIDRLNSGDAGGQYDSSGGAGGRGNPQGSSCEGYNHYVELIEPGARRACIRCCDNPGDCPVNRDTAGCQAVIPGDYFDCS